FFFQAEDGIRDPLVTGVQTCALPISPPSHSMTRSATVGSAASLRWAIVLLDTPHQPARSHGEGLYVARAVAGCGLAAALYSNIRSEERRVGKECGSWWWT